MQGRQIVQIVPDDVFITGIVFGTDKPGIRRNKDTSFCLIISVFPGDLPWLQRDAHSVRHDGRCRRHNRKRPYEDYFD